MKISRPLLPEAPPIGRTPQSSLPRAPGKGALRGVGSTDRVEVTPEAAAARSADEAARRATRDLIAATNRDSLWTPGRDLRDVASLLRHRVPPA